MFPTLLRIRVQELKIWILEFDIRIQEFDIRIKKLKIQIQELKIQIQKSKMKIQKLINQDAKASRVIVEKSALLIIMCVSSVYYCWLIKTPLPT